MNYITVDLYQNFECIADACPNTCCAGWNISIDESTHQKMIEHEKELGTPAKDWLIESNGRIYAKMQNQKCCMLDENNLCKVVCTLGPEYLSQTCQQYPRILRSYGNVIEGHLTMSCPVIIDALMTKDNVLFDFTEDKTPVSPYEHGQLYLFASAVRSGIIDILQQFPDITLPTRLFVSYKILETAVALYQKNQLNSQLINQEIDYYFGQNIMHSLDTQLYEVVNEANRFHFLKQLHTILYDAIPSHEHFVQLITQTCNYFSQKSLEEYLSDLAAFRINTQKYYSFYTNYWVYHSFSDMIKIPDYNRITENLLYIAAEFCLIQAIALAAFANSKELNRDEYIFIISHISRTMEHNRTFRTQLIEKLIENNVINPAGLLLMTLI